MGLVEFIYSDPKKGGLGWDLDFIVPFAAIPENGFEIDGIDSRSELAHRLMLTNVLRLIGAVKTQKAAQGIITRPAQVILPLSPNHGTFGSDGLYSESNFLLRLFSTDGTLNLGLLTLPFVVLLLVGLVVQVLCLRTMPLLKASRRWVSAHSPRKRWPSTFLVSLTTKLSTFARNPCLGRS